MSDLKTSNDLNQVKEIFSSHANVEDAKKMAAYMRNHFDFYGIKSPTRRQISRDFVNKSKKQKQIDWTFLEKAMTDSYREINYLALDILKANKDRLAIDDFDRLIGLAKIRPWWDSIDAIDTIIGSLDGDNFSKKILDLSTDDNFWLRRIAIDCQLLKKDKTDKDLLAAVIENNLGIDFSDKDEKFFINKAIGWSLRSFSKTDPAWVRDFLEKNKDKLDNLSIREASKYL
uniref:DNA alkylation repair protein n=1 Tax=Anaerococcus mediterraneensis TaxID=1870984 RepID=UPI0009305F58|nr:DNA alkylation repair protein [Anaerococcus mediterraneensis]